jgi:flagellar protein FlaG
VQSLQQIQNTQGSNSVSNIPSTQQVNRVVGADNVPSSTPATTSTPTKTPQSTDRVNQLEDVNELNDRLESQSIQVQFGVDDDTGRIVVKVQDSNTKEVIRQIPSQEALDFARLARQGKGIMLSTTI